MLPLVAVVACASYVIGYLLGRRATLRELSRRDDAAQEITAEAWLEAKRREVAGRVARRRAS